jgi:DNA-binding transcriptional LysR family regulator
LDLRTLDWDRLKIFQAVAEEGSINAAALRLSVSQAKVSRDMEELEAAIGKELFVRSPRGTQLTPLGADVLRSVRNMADSARAIGARIQEVDQSRTVVIATHDAIATYWLGKRVSELYRVFPALELNIKVVEETPDLMAGDADISIQYDRPNASNVIARQLCWLHFLLYAAPSYLDELGVPETMFDLGRHRFLTHSGYRKQREAWGAKTPAWMEILTRGFQSNSSAVLLEACAAGIGIAPMPTYVSEVETRVVPLVHIPPLSSVRLWIAYSERLRGVPAAEAVLQWLRDAYDPAAHFYFREAFIPPTVEGMSPRVRAVGHHRNDAE